ncbi:MAG: hypothetical protein ABSF91_05820 [Bacteroidota bacterium]|jgi:hypothetical protein
MDVSTMFAVLYILSQAVERVVELVSDFAIWGDPHSKEPAVLHRRAISLWIVSTLLGMVVCSVFCIDFFRVLKPDGACDPGPVLKFIINGIIVGSGTKPVHDVIAGLEKYARKQ